MNFKEFKDRIESICNISIGKNEDLENLEVVVTIDNPSVGGRAKSKVKGIYRGIDWEHKQIRIDTEDKLIKDDSNKLQQIQEVVNNHFKYNGFMERNCDIETIASILKE